MTKLALMLRVWHCASSYLHTCMRMQQLHATTDDQNAVETHFATHKSSAFVQGRPVRLETANAALLEGSGETWADAFASDSDWKLVGVLVP